MSIPRQFFRNTLLLIHAKPQPASPNRGEAIPWIKFYITEKLYLEFGAG